MDKFTIICSVAAEFESPDGEKFRVKPEDRNLILQAPAWIRNTENFKWYANDGSLKCVTSANKIQLENDPTLGLDAEGKDKARGRKKADKIEDSVQTGS